MIPDYQDLADDIDRPLDPREIRRVAAVLALPVAVVLVAIVRWLAS